MTAEIDRLGELAAKHAPGVPPHAILDSGDDQVWVLFQKNILRCNGG
jgi:hypothetical protein